MKSIKNFCIIAHIDHGKSTLSDRLIELASEVTLREMRPQMLDSMDLERERGITIKLNSVRLQYGDYQLNLIDTPGHADFSYEVSRSLSACEGAILIIDATQGIQAQTISNFLLALKCNLTMVVAINKVDSPAAQIEMVREQIRNDLGMDPDDAVPISAKLGTGIDQLLEKCLATFPSAKRMDEAPLKALIFDSYYDAFRGVVSFVRIFEGTLRKGDKLLFMRNGNHSDAVEVGIKTITSMRSVDQLSSGEVGWLITNVKNLKEIKVGDTITTANNPCSDPLPGYEEILPMIYASFFPPNGEKYKLFKLSIEKLSLSDGSFEYQWESSPSLGFGCRCGFLGLLHMEIIRERLLREYLVEVIVTQPSVKYEVHLTDGTHFYLSAPSDLPDITRVSMIKEPYIVANIRVPMDYTGRIMELMEKFRSRYISLEYPSSNIACLVYELPLSEIIQDFYDSIKSVTNGYGIMDYELSEYRESNLVKVDILINGTISPPLSFIVEKGERAYRKSKKMVEKLKELIPQHLFTISIQAAINNRIICREDIRSLGKNVTAKCYGGDITRKKKLWEKQKKGKERMKQIGKVSLPEDIFQKIFKN